MSLRKAESRWEGGLKDGRGTMKLGSGAFTGPYSFSSRFEEGPGTNPEELIGAALSGCFSMFLAGTLAQEGHPPTSITTRASVHLGEVAGQPRLTRIELDCEAVVPGLSEELFQEKATFSKANCPISNALSGPEISLRARLQSDVRGDA